MPQDNNTIDDIWSGDLLDRREDAEFIQSFLIGRLDEREAEGKERSYVLNIDARWGGGKTFFLERFAKQLRAAGHPVAFVNAWKDDFTDEPMTAVMNAIDITLKDHLNQSDSRFKQFMEGAQRNFGAILLSGAKGGAKAVVKRYTGAMIDDIGEALETASYDNDPALQEMILGAGEAAGQEVQNKIDKLFDRTGAAALSDFNRTTQSIERFRNSLAQVVNSLNGDDARPPLFVLVDELDRCRPLYAIELLERIKHIFNIANVVFVVATDTEQLQHSIRAVYGAEFNSQRYLHRFFDRVYRFSEPDKRAFIEQLMSAAKLDESKCHVPEGVKIKEAVVYIYSYFGGSLELRDIEQIHDLLRTVTTTWKHPVPIELTLMLPLMIGWKLGLRLNHSQYATAAASMTADR